MNPFRRKISMGGFSKAELLDRMEATGTQLNLLALEMFSEESFRTQGPVCTIEVVLKTVGELGLPNGGVLSKAIDSAAALGFGLCPLELAPYLRMAWVDQEEGAIGFESTQYRAPPGSITVVDRRPKDDESEYRGFYLRRIEGTLWLRGYKSWSGHVWQPQDMLVFTSASNSA